MLMAAEELHLDINVCRGSTFKHILPEKKKTVATKRKVTWTNEPPVQR